MEVDHNDGNNGMDDDGNEHNLKRIGFAKMLVQTLNATNRIR